MWQCAHQRFRTSFTVLLHCTFLRVSFVKKPIKRYASGLIILGTYCYLLPYSYRHTHTNALPLSCGSPAISKSLGPIVPHVEQEMHFPMRTIFYIEHIVFVYIQNSTYLGILLYFPDDSPETGRSADV